MNTDIDWNKYARAYDLMCNLAVEYRELLDITSNLISSVVGDSQNLGIDLGSGTGNVVINLSQKLNNFNFFSLELHPAFVHRQREKLKTNGLENRINLVEGDILNLPEEIPNNFNLLTMFHVLNFMPLIDRVQVIQTAYDLILPGGYFAISDIGREIPVDDWLEDILNYVDYNHNLGERGEILTQLEPAILANRRALTLQKEGHSYMHNLDDFNNFISSFGFDIIDARDDLYRGIDDFVIARKL